MAANNGSPSSSAAVRRADKEVAERRNASALWFLSPLPLEGERDAAQADPASAQARLQKHSARALHYNRPARLNVMTLVYRFHSLPRQFSMVMLAVLLVPSIVSAQPLRRSVARPGPLLIAGCDSSMGIVRLLADDFRKSGGAEIEFLGGGSTNGIWLAAGGAFVLGVSSRPLRGAEQEFGLTVLPFARTPIVLVAHHSVPDNDVTTTRLLRLYRGIDSHWRDGHPVKFIVREIGHGSMEILRRAIPGFAAVETVGPPVHVRTMYDEAASGAAIATTPHALGVSDLGAVTVERFDVKTLNINGVAPTAANIVNGSYPLVKTIAFLFEDEFLPPSAIAFLQFVESRRGAEILRAHGYLPVQ